MDSTTKNIAVSVVIALTSLVHIWQSLGGEGNEFKIFLGVVILVASVFGVVISVRKKLKNSAAPEEGRDT